MIGELCSQSEMSFVKILDQGDVPFRDGSTIDLGEALFYFRVQLGYVSKLSYLTTGAVGGARQEQEEKDWDVNLSASKN